MLRRIAVIYAMQYMRKNPSLTWDIFRQIVAICNIWSSKFRTGYVSFARLARLCPTRFVQHMSTATSNEYLFVQTATFPTRHIDHNPVINWLHSSSPYSPTHTHYAPVNHLAGPRPTSLILNFNRQKRGLNYSPLFYIYWFVNSFLVFLMMVFISHMRKSNQLIWLPSFIACLILLYVYIYIYLYI